MKRLMMLMAALAVVPLLAATERVGGYTWTYRLNGDTAEIYSDHYTAVSPSPSGHLDIPATLGGKPVTRIGVDAFTDCGSLTSVTLPDSVTHIGSCAFYHCPELTNVTLSASLKCIGAEAFECCFGLKDIVIPDGVTTIGSFAFKNCSSLTELTMPNSVINIGYGVFRGCEGLADENGFVIFCNRLFGYYGEVTDVVIPNGVTSIDGVGPQLSDDSALEESCCMTSVVIPESVTNIGERAFAYCDTLTNVTFSGTIPTIGIQAFSWCEGLVDTNGFAIVCNRLFGYSGEAVDVVIPDGVTSIEQNAFDCYDVMSVTIPASTTAIRGEAFYGCNHLTTIRIANPDVAIDWTAFRDCAYLASVEIAAKEGHTQTAWQMTFQETVYAVNENTGDCFTAYGVGETVMFSPDDLSFLISGSVTTASGDVGTVCDCYEDKEDIGGSLMWEVRVPVWVTAVWEEIASPATYTLTFDTDGGSEVAPVTQEAGTEIVPPEAPVREGFTFVRWEPALPATMPASNLTVTAVWEAVAVIPPAAPEIFEGDAADDDVFAGDAQYTGWLRDAEGNLVGTVTVKAAKANKKTGASKLTATVVMLDNGKKLAFAGTATAGQLANVTLSGKSGSMNVTLSDDSVTGTYGAYTIEAAKNVFTSKDSGDKPAAASVPKKSWIVTLASAKGYTSFTLAVAAKGKAKVTGVLPDGTKVSVSAQAVVGDGGRWAVPVMFAKKSKFGFVAWFDANGFTTVSDLTPLKGPKGAVTEWEAALDACGPVGSLAAGAHALAVDAASVEALIAAVNAELLPVAEAVTVSGNKWTLAKAAKVAYKGGAWTVTPGTKGGAIANASGAKLTFTPKTGAFKGSFTAYSVKGGRLVKTKFTVNGAVVNGTAYGTAFNKTAGCVPLTVR